jgi:60 kDa SS-A/Ro ribonucleoprotein
MAVYAVTNRKRTRQSQPIPGSTQVPNSAGGYSWQLDDLGKLRRFLILGSEGGTYYIAEQDLLKQNTTALSNCLNTDPAKAIGLIVEVSDKGLAYRNEAAVYALAVAASHKKPEVRKLALAALPKVVRIGTHLFHWAHYVNSMRGWGRSLRTSIGEWYLSKNPEQLALQAVKYQQRDGWSHKDMLRLAHPRTEDEAKDAVLRWIVGGKAALNERKVKRKLGAKKDQVREHEYPSRLTALPQLIQAFEEAKHCDEKRVIGLIVEHDLPREAIPTQLLNSVAVWEALLEKMPATAMIRNLAKMTNVGLIKPLSKASKSVIGKLKDTAWLKKSRCHPMQFLLAARVYNQGHGEKGKMAWSPDQGLVSALEQAFYASFPNVEPIGKPTLLALDVSGSMDGSMVAGTCLSAREGTAALALVHLNIEEQIAVMGFSHELVEVKLRKGMSIVDAMRHLAAIPMGGTNCALPFVWAGENQMDVEAFITMTDSETWHGGIHPAQALTAYRQASGNAARSVVVGMCSNAFTIADPNDAGSLDVVGFDASSPSLIGDFCRGDI